MGGCASSQADILDLEAVNGGMVDGLSPATTQPAGCRHFFFGGGVPSVHFFFDGGVKDALFFSTGVRHRLKRYETDESRRRGRGGGV